MKLESDLLRNYAEELTYLRTMGREFARQHPTVAGRLEIQDGFPADPHVERLIESFAFMTSRIQYQLEAEFPDISTSLLGVLYPHLVHPVPPLSTARFVIDGKRGKFTTGHTVPKNSSLFAYEAGGATCRFRTCYPVTVWPIHIEDVSLEPAIRYDFASGNPRVTGILRVRLAASVGSLAELEIDSLRFFLNPRSGPAFTLYELLFSALEGISLVRDSNENAPISLPLSSLSAVGFGKEDDLLPAPRQAHPAYRLIQEYLHFPDKFLYFDIAGFSKPTAQHHLDLLFLLNRMPKERTTLELDAVQLGCTPIANLFPRTTEPIRLDQRQLYYRLVPDMRRERTTEIHSIEKVSGSTNPADPTRVYQPFYSFRHSDDSVTPSAFWHIRREMTGREDRPGTDVFLSFLDLNFQMANPPDEVIFAHTLCTNRWLAQEVPAAAVLQLEQVGPVNATCLSRPTAPVHPPLGGPSVWRLISNLSLNHVSLTAGADGFAALKELLAVYCFGDQPGMLQQVQGIRGMNVRETTLRLGRDAWRGFCPGMEVTLTFDEGFYAGRGAFLFATVLRHFLSLYTSINSFTQLVARHVNREEEWKRWPPLAGYERLI